MSLDPGTLGAINTFALAAIVVLLVTGLLHTKPAHDFVIRLLAESHGREAALEKELGRTSDTIEKQTDLIADMGEKLERMTTSVARLEEALAGRRRGT